MCHSESECYTVRVSVTPVLAAAKLRGGERHAADKDREPAAAWPGTVHRGGWGRRACGLPGHSTVHKERLGENSLGEVGTIYSKPKTYVKHDEGETRRHRQIIV